MRLVAVTVGFALLAGCSQYRLRRTPDPDEVWMGAKYGMHRRAGMIALQAKDYRAAIREYSTGAAAARKDGDSVSHCRFLANLSVAYLLAFENRRAIEVLLAAREAAGAGRDLVTLQTVEANLANLYIQTGDGEAATAAALRGSAIHPPKQQPETRITTLLSFGRAIARTRGLAAAEPIFREAYQIADANALTAQEAEILDLWGNEATESDQFTLGEDLLARAWCKRRIAKDGRISLTEGKLGRLYRKMGRYQTAGMWMDRVQVAVTGGTKIPLPVWIVTSEQGHVLAGEGRLTEALAKYRESVDWARRWRETLPPAERIRLGAERRMQEMFDGLLRTAGQIYKKHPDGQLSAEMFSVIQTTRAWSMEKNREGGQAEEAMYARARRLEGKWLGGDSGVKEELTALRAAILEKEVGAAGDETVTSAGRLEAPGEGEAILTYWLDEDGSWLWVWTKTGLRVTSLPSRNIVLQEAKSFRTAVAENAPDRQAKGERLLATLLGGLGEECLRATRWDIVADEGLFAVPFAALPVGKGQFLIERAELRLIPNALRQPRSAKPAEQRFLAVADPIFNAADERRDQSWFWQRRVHAGTYAMELPRLPGTRREAEAGRAIWRKAGYDTALHLGAESSEEAVLARISEWQPRILHIATHTATPAGEEAKPRLALSLRPDGSPGLLAAADIAALPLRTELVIMSACRSTGDETARGAGLLGLTRAWLAAGSRDVVATLWPVGDESTAFFTAFHKRLAASEADKPLPVASALRQAQLACLRAGGTTAAPQFWAGHVLLARR